MKHNNIAIKLRQRWQRIKHFLLHMACPSTASNIGDISGLRAEAGIGYTHKGICERMRLEMVANDSPKNKRLPAAIS